MRTTAHRYIERFDIEQKMETELADKARLIAVVNKAIDEAVVRTREAEALQTLAESEEQIESRRAEEKAKRAKTVEITDAEARAERERIRTTKMAEARKEASERHAEAEIAEARAAEFRYGVDAEGNRKLNEAENSRNQESRRSAQLEGVVNRLPEIIREQVKPLEYDSIKILQRMVCPDSTAQQADRKMPVQDLMRISPWSRRNTVHRLRLLIFDRDRLPLKILVLPVVCHFVTSLSQRR